MIDLSLLAVGGGIGLVGLGLILDFLHGIQKGR